MKQLAVLYLDLDHFKSVNDTLGHPVGDELLSAVADRLRRCVREADTVARLGGDEFAIVQTGRGAAERRHDAGHAHLSTRSGSLTTSTAISSPSDTSIGIAMAPGDGTEPDQLLKNADVALYRAKAEGRGTYHFFEPEMDARMQARRSFEFDLRQAIMGGEFELYYQPCRQHQGQDRSAASKRCCAGTIPNAAWCRPPSSSRSRRRSA